MVFYFVLILFSPEFQAAIKFDKQICLILLHFRFNWDETVFMYKLYFSVVWNALHKT